MKKYTLLKKFNLQLFAEGEGEGAEGTPGEGGAEGADEGKDDKTDDKQKEIDSLIGKAVDKALKNNDKKWQDILDEKIAETKKQAEAYAKLSAKEKEEADLKRREDELAEKETAFAKKELLVNIKNDLQEQTLPLSFAEALVVIGDAEKIKAAISEIKTEWDNQINEAIKAKARQSDPKEGSQNEFQGNSAMNIRDMANKARII